MILPTIGSSGPITISFTELWHSAWIHAWDEIGELVWLEATGCWHADNHVEHTGDGMFFIRLAGRDKPPLECQCFDCRALRAWKTQ